MSEDTHLINTLECLLFAAKEPLPVQRLAEVMQCEATDLPRLLHELNERRTHTGLHAAHLAGGWVLATRPEYAEAVQRLLEPDPQRLSIQALETLAIIAYRQPITRPEVDEIRGVNSSGAVTSLIEKDLVRIAGRKDAPGRPFLLQTTAHFLSVFGLSELAELPDIGELRRRMEQQYLVAAEGGDEATGAQSEPAEQGDPAVTDAEGGEAPSTVTARDPGEEPD
jgi:segregation and condensation protein B